MIAGGMNNSMILGSWLMNILRLYGLINRSGNHERRVG